MRGHCLDCGRALEELNITEEHGEKRLSGFCRRCHGYSNSPLYSDDDILIDERIPHIPPIAGYKYSCLPEAKMDTLKQQHEAMRVCLTEILDCIEATGEKEKVLIETVKELLAKLAEGESGEG